MPLETSFFLMRLDFFRYLDSYVSFRSFQNYAVNSNTNALKLLNGNIPKISNNKPQSMIWVGIWETGINPQKPNLTIKRITYMPRKP